MSDLGPRRGEVWLARLDKVRPVVVLTRDPMVARTHLVRRVGRVRPATMRAICDALSIAVGCQP